MAYNRAPHRWALISEFAFIGLFADASAGPTSSVTCNIAVWR
ncbi:MAG: hypothetical protein QOJ56_5577 [Mycobacterium sp.]|jgi:hypothetical protein|nr:hypothetical protein [Mycobacterium sp.]